MRNLSDVALIQLLPVDLDLLLLVPLVQLHLMLWAVLFLAIDALAGT